MKKIEGQLDGKPPFEEEKHFHHPDSYQSSWCEVNTEQALVIAKENGLCCWMHGKLGRTSFGERKLEIAG